MSSKGKHTKSNTIYKKQKDTGIANDLAIPVICCLVILPLVVRFTVIDSGMNEYSWFPTQAMMSDIFTYYKYIVLLLIGLTCFLILAISYMVGYKTSKDPYLDILFGCYALCVILSSIQSVHKGVTLGGYIKHYESVFVIFTYLILSIYIYRIIQVQHYKTIIKSYLIGLSLISIIGLGQLFGQDIFLSSIGKKLIMSSDDYKRYGDFFISAVKTGAISLTLSNPNSAAVYLVMGILFVLVFFLLSNIVQVRILMGGLACILSLLLYRTYTRTGLLALFAGILILIIFPVKRKERGKSHIVLLMIGILGLCLGMELLGGGYFSSRIRKTLITFGVKEVQRPLQSIQTKQDCVIVFYHGVEYTCTLADQNVTVTPSIREEDQANFYTEFYSIDGLDYMKLVIQDTEWYFTYIDTEGYVYVNESNCYETLNDIPSWGFEDQYSFGSGRGYIWSRTLPLLKQYMLYGSGPDTFAFVFPQNDRVGKLQYCKERMTVIEGPHNMYLQMAIHTGVSSVIVFILLYSYACIKFLKFMRKKQQLTMPDILGYACFVATIGYMVSGLFIDSSIQTSPVFWCLFGLMLSVTKLEIDKE